MRPETRLPMRMQVAIDGRLAAEAIVEADDVGPFVKGGGIWERFAKAKWRAGKSAGGAIIRRADHPRPWDVKVGEVIP